ncbi:hypothetical protein J6Z39_08010 [bacterium]|nr:hypothetical protein [bacterium]
MKSGRIDKIRSWGSAGLLFAGLLLYFAFAEFSVRLNSDGPVGSNLKFVPAGVLTEEEMASAKKFAKDLKTVGKRFRGVPNTLVYRYLPAKTDSFTLNSTGFRGEELQKKKKGEFRIGMLGDSRVLGAYLKTEATIPCIVEQRLKELMPEKHITVLNLGFEAYDLSREIAFAELYYARLDVDMFVFVYSVNDINFSYMAGDFEMTPFKDDSPFSEVVFRLRGDDWLSRFSEFWVDNFYIADVVKKSFDLDMTQTNLRKGAEEKPLDPVRAAYSEKFAGKLIAKMARTADYLNNEKKIKTLFFLAPLVEYKKHHSRFESKLSFFYNNEKPGYREYVHRCVDPLVNEAKKESLPFVFISQMDIFDDYDDTLFWDYIHYTPKGSRIVALDIAKHLYNFLSDEEAADKSEKSR